MEVSIEIYRICNIHFQTNRKKVGFRKNLIYAELRTTKGELVISATLDYICEKIIERDYKGENFEVSDELSGKGVRIGRDAIGERSLPLTNKKP